MQHLVHVLNFTFILFMFATVGTSLGAAANARSRKLSETNIWRYMGLLFGLALVTSVIGGVILEAIGTAGFGDFEKISYAISGVILLGIPIAAFFPRPVKDTTA